MVAGQGQHQDAGREDRGVGQHGPESIRKLAEQGLVDHEKYGAVTLTDSGRRAALAMVRRHRLLETFLVNELGYRWDEVHDEAEVLEHAVSDRLMARIDAKLGFP